MTRTAPSPTRSIATPFAFALLLAATGCGGAGGAFSTKFPDNRDADIEELLSRIAAASQPREATVAVGVTAAPTKLFGFDLASRRVLWQMPIQADVAPYLAGEVAVVQSGDQILGYDLQTGARRFSASAGGRTLNGAAGDAGRVVVVLTKGMGTFSSSEVMYFDGGSERWSHEVAQRAGQPALVGSMALVPWSNQFLSALDLKTGKELARVRVRDGVLGHAIFHGGNVFIGSHHGIARVTSSVGSGTLKGSGFLGVEGEKLPGRPAFLRDVYAPGSAPAADSAQHRIALSWQPTVVDGIRTGLEDDNLYLVFYRFVFALHPKDLSFRWVYLHPRDIVGASAQAGGLAIADEAGSFGFVGAASGELSWTQAAGLTATVVRLPSAGGGGAAGEAASPATNRARLLEAAQDTDARLVPARLLAVEFLSHMEDAEATSNLIALCDDTRVAPPVRKAACETLENRSIGKEHLLAALERHAGYLEGTTAPPVGALARAAASLKETRAVSLLVAHLKDPATPSRDLPKLVQALGELGDVSAAGPLTDFLLLYHADPIDEHLVRALELTPEVLVKLAGPVATEALETVSSDGLSALGVREKARVALESLRAAAIAAEKTDEAEQKAQEVAAEEAPADPSKYAPTHLTVAVVQQTLLPVRDQLQACLVSGPEPVFQARVVLVVEDGVVLMVSVLPKELQGCVEPLIRSQPFPATKVAKKERLTYTLKRQ